MHSELPLVSCVMPTANRPTFARAAMESFRAQTYPYREMVIVDDGRRRSFLMAPDGVRYTVAHALDLGSKRNLCCSLTRGEIVVTWDDDDIYAPNRIEKQVAELLRSRADVVGSKDLDFQHQQTGEIYRYTGFEPMDCPGVTLVYRREYWRQNAFKRATMGEERAFLAQAYRTKKLHLMDVSGLITATIHPGNTSPRDVRKNPWRKVA